jgi:hypothetical protein
MEKKIKKIVSYILISTVVIVTGIGILSVWDIVDIDAVIHKMLLSLFIIFVATVVILFIFSVLLRDSFKD